MLGNTRNCERRWMIPAARYGVYRFNELTRLLKFAENTKHYAYQLKLRGSSMKLRMDDGVVLVLMSDCMR
jgi:hypothetical protein